MPIRPMAAPLPADGGTLPKLSVITVGRGARDRVAGGDITVGPGEHVRDAVAIGGSVHLSASARVRDAVAIGGSIDLAPDARVERDAVSIGGKVHLAPGARVDRDAVAVLGKVIAEKGAKVGRDKSSVEPTLEPDWMQPSDEWKVSSWLWNLGSFLARFATFFGLGAILLLVAPRQLEAISAAVRTRTLRAGVVGFFGTLALPVVTLFLLVTVVGILLIPVELFGALLGSVMGWTALALGIGKTLRLGERLPWKGAPSPFLELALGALIVLLLGEIPFLGTLAWISGWFLTFGAALLTRFGSVHGEQPGGTV